MASLWFTLGVIFYVISEIIAVPLRIMPQENEYSRLNQNLESGLSEQETPNIRVKRQALPAGCENGSRFVVANEPQCTVKDAKYYEEHELCLAELLHVPGMPDGHKGYHYIALNHILYKFSNATIVKTIVECPTTTTNLATRPQTTPATGSNVAPRNTPSTATNQAVNQV